jgi:hypothetical protein
MLLGLAKEPQLEGWGMDQVAETFRRGIQVALAITDKSGGAVSHAQALLDDAAYAFGKLCGGDHAPRPAPAPAPEIPHLGPPLGPWP